MLTQPPKKQPDDPKYRLWLRFSQVALIIVLLVTTALFFPRGKIFEFDYHVDQITTETVIAPFDFDILKTESELEDDRQERANSVFPVYLWDGNVRDSVSKHLDILTGLLRDWQTAERIYGNKQLNFAEVQDPLQADSLTLLLEQDSLAIAAFKAELMDRGMADLGTPRWQWFLDETLSSRSLVNAVKRGLLPLYKLGIIEAMPTEDMQPRITMILRGRESTRNPADFITLDRAEALVNKSVTSTYYQDDNRLRQLAMDISMASLQPNLRYSHELTENRKLEAQNSVPISIGKVFENERIVDANTRVTEEIKQKLTSLEKEYIRRGYGGSTANRMLTFLGKILLTSFLIFFFFAYLQTYRTLIYNDIKLLVLVGLLFLMHIASAYLIVYEMNWSEYFIPMSIAAMIFTVVFDGRIAFIAMVTLTLIVGIILSNNMPFIIANLFVSSLAIYTVRRLRARSQILWSILAVTFGYVSVIAVNEMIKFTGWDQVMEHMLFATANGFIAPLISYGFLILIERSFKITTNLTLLELLDFNNKLLRHLAMRAPGTFKHSIDVGNLAMAAADAVGANSLLTRVGAYYHDVGKAEKPEYFIENQRGSENKHENLSPRLSATVIVAHVKDGIRMAKDHNLPDIITDFIPMHHGRTRVEYFYSKAKERAKENDSDLNEEDFRYPGPRPNTRETGILMIAEAVEAASRSVKNPTPQRVETLIDSIIESRIKNDELANCPLTFRDLATIKEAMMPVLLGSLHERVEYPGQREKLHIPENED